MARNAPEWGHPVPLTDISAAAAIVGVGEAAYSRASGRTAVEIAIEAAERAIDDAGLMPSDIDGLTWSEYAPSLTPEVFCEHFGVAPPRFVSDQCGAMTGAGVAPYVAARAIARGRATYVLNTYAVAWATERDQMVGGPGESYLAMTDKRNLEVPFGFFPQPVYFATIAQRHMIELGTTSEQLGAVAVTQRRHANLTPGAVMGDRPMDLAAYLAAPMVADPLRVPDCSLISDGGAAFITAGADRARDLPRPPVSVGGVGLGLSHAGLHWTQQEPMTATPQVFSAPGAFAMAGISPDDVDVVEVYDPFTIVALMQVEDMGFFERGEAGPVAAAGGFDHLGGRLPLNTHGGLLSHAYVMGIAHVVELVRQLRGEAAAQVPGCAIGVYGGYTGMDASTLVLVRGV